MRGQRLVGRCAAASVMLLALAQSVTGQCGQWVWQLSQAQPGFYGGATGLASWDPDGPGSVLPLLLVDGPFVASNGGDVGASSWDGTAWTRAGNSTPFAFDSVSVWNNTPVALNSQSVQRLVNGSWQTIGALSLSGFETFVHALGTMANGDLFVRGPFDSINGVPASGLARWNGSTWQALGTPLGLDGFTGSEQTHCALPNGEFVVGGFFTSAGGVSANNIVRWNGTAWQPLGSGTNGTVLASVVHNGSLIVGGVFGSAGGQPANYVARWTGTAWQPLGAGLPRTVQALGVAGGTLYAAVTHPDPGSLLTADCVYRWDGASWSTVGVGVTNGNVTRITDWRGSLVVAGDFGGIGGFALDGLARWDGTRWQPVGTPLNGLLYAQCVFNNDLYVGGVFETHMGVPAANIARWNGTTWSAVGTGISPGAPMVGVNGMTVYNGSLYVGGAFTTAGGVNASNIARWNGTSWSAVGSGTNGPVTRMTVWNNQLYVGGQFTTAGGAAASNLAVWNGTTWNSVGGGVRGSTPGSGSVQDMAVYNNALIVGGAFTTVGAGAGTPAASIARWNGTAWSTMGSGTAGGVQAFAQLGGDLYVGGSFGGTISGLPAFAIAKWNGTTWSAAGNGLAGSVQTLSVYNNRVYAGGFLFNFPDSGQNVAVLNGSQWSALPGGGADKIVFSLTPYAGDLCIGGGFESVGQRTARAWARWRDGAAPVVEFQTVAGPFSGDPCEVNAAFRVGEAETNGEGEALITTTWQLETGIGTGVYSTLTNGPVPGAPATIATLPAFLTSTPVLTLAPYSSQLAGRRVRATAANTCGTVNLNPVALPTQTCCPADIGTTGGTQGNDGLLNSNDFIVFIDLFFAFDGRADRGTTGGTPTPDGAFDNNDFIVFIDQFFDGCQ